MIDELWIADCSFSVALSEQVRDSSIVYGGGAAELACSLAIEAEAERVAGVDQYSMQAFADALESIPLALAENSGLPPIESLTEVCYSSG